MGRALSSPLLPSPRRCIFQVGGSARVEVPSRPTPALPYTDPHTAPGPAPQVCSRRKSWQISEAQYTGRSVGGAFLSEVEAGSPASVA